MASFLVLVESIGHLCCKDLSRVCAFLFNLVLTAVIKFCTYHQLYYSSTVTGCQPRSTLTRKEKKTGPERELQDEWAETTVGRVEEREKQSHFETNPLSTGKTGPATSAQPRPVELTLAIKGTYFTLLSVICKPSWLWASNYNRQSWLMNLHLSLQSSRQKLETNHTHRHQGAHVQGDLELQHLQRMLETLWLHFVTLLSALQVKSRKCLINLMIKTRSVFKKK